MFIDGTCQNEKIGEDKRQSVVYAIAGKSKKPNTAKNKVDAVCGEKQRKLLAEFVNQTVAIAHDLPPEKLMQYSRGKAVSARARQISIYLMHTTLSFSFTEIGKVYSKDRTTIAHACRVIEDLRDEENFDHKITQLEKVINTVLTLDAVINSAGRENV